MKPANGRDIQSHDYCRNLPDARNLQASYRKKVHPLPHVKIYLQGGLVYASIFDNQAVPFDVRDVTGDGRPEIIVTSGVGASLGGALQIYSFDGSSLHQIALAQGHTLHLENGRSGKPAEITAQSRYEEKPRRFRWNGHAFAQT